MSEAYGEYHGDVYRAEWSYTPDGHKIEFSDLSKKVVSRASSKTPLGRVAVLEKDGNESFSVENANRVCLFKKNGSEYGRYEYSFNLINDVICVDTPDGTLSVIPKWDIVGKSILIKLGEKVIGTCCYELNAGFVDIIDMTYAVHVRDEKWRDLVFLFSAFVFGSFQKRELP